MKPISKYINNFGSDKLDVCLVAVANGELVGASWGRLFSEANQGYGFLDVETPELSIAIKEQFRNQGIGGRLIEEIVAVYRTLNVRAVSLSVDKNNSALRLYRRMGFEVVEESGRSVVMRKKI